MDAEEISCVENDIRNGSPADGILLSIVATLRSTVVILLSVSRKKDGLFIQLITLNLSMPQHEQKSCPRCQAVFICKTGDITHCQCSHISLTTEETAFIEDRYNDCLCLNCLQDLRYKYIFFKEKFLFNER